MIKILKAFNETEQKIYNYLINDMGYDDTEAKSIIDYGEYILVEGQNERDLGYNFIHNVLSGFSEVADKDKEKYFDFAKFAQLFIDENTFIKNDNNEYIDTETAETEDEINTSTTNLEDLGKWIFENYKDSNINNINDEDLEKCFNYEAFGKMLLDEADFDKLDNEYYIQAR